MEIDGTSIKLSVGNVETLYNNMDSDEQQEFRENVGLDEASDESSLNQCVNLYENLDSDDTKAFFTTVAWADYINPSAGEMETLYNHLTSDEQDEFKGLIGIDKRDENEDGDIDEALLQYNNLDDDQKRAFFEIAPWEGYIKPNQSDVQDLFNELDEEDQASFLSENERGEGSSDSEMSPTLAKFANEFTEDELKNIYKAVKKAKASI